jgi:hypothetical protein
MVDNDNYMRHQLDPDFDHPADASPHAVSEEQQSVEGLIEDAAQRRLPPGHIAFAGQTALERYRPKL